MPERRGNQSVMLSRMSTEKDQELRWLCQQMKQQLREFSTFSPLSRKKAFLNQARGLLLAETQKVAEKYNNIGSKNSFSSRDWPSELKSISKVGVQWHESVNISSTLKCNPAHFLPNAETSDLRKVVLAMRILSIDELIQKYESKATQLEKDDVVADLKKAKTYEKGAKVLENIMSEYEGMDIAYSVANVQRSTDTNILKKLKALHVLAAAAIPIFTKVMNEIKFHSETSMLGIEVQIGPPKLVGRTADKTKRDYGNDPGRILDVLRGSIICKSIESMESVMIFLREQLSERHGVVVLRVKNGFKPLVAVSTYGYRDVKINIWIPCDKNILKALDFDVDSSAGIIGEIQLHLKEMYDIKKEMGHKMYSWIRRSEIAGITSPDIMFSYGVDVSECSVALAVSTILSLLDATASVATAASTSAAEDVDVEAILTAEEKDDLRLSGEIIKSSLTVEERIGREVEILRYFAKYRSTVIAVRLDDFSDGLMSHMTERVKPIAELAFGQVPAIDISLENKPGRMDRLIQSLRSELGNSAALLQLLEYLNKEHCKGRSLHLKLACREVALEIYQDTRNPMYLAFLVGLFHDRIFGMVRLLNSWVQDFVLGYSAVEFIHNISTGSIVEKSNLQSDVDAESAPKLRIVGLNDSYHQRSWASRTFMTMFQVVLVFLALPVTPFVLLWSSTFRDILLAPIRLRLLPELRQKGGPAHPLCDMRPLSVFVLQILAVYLLIGYLILRIQFHWDGYVYISIAFAASLFLTYFSHNPHRILQPWYINFFYLAVMRANVFIGSYCVVVAVLVSIPDPYWQDLTAELTFSAVLALSASWMFCGLLFLLLSTMKVRTKDAADCRHNRLLSRAVEMCENPLSESNSAFQG